MSVSTNKCPIWRFLAEKSTHEIGRASLLDPNRLASIDNLLFVQQHLSKHHAELRWILDKLYVVDNELSLGTMLNNKMLVHGKLVEIEAGDILGFAIYKPIKEMEQLEKTAKLNNEDTVRLDNVRTNFQIKIRKIDPLKKIIHVSKAFPFDLMNPSTTKSLSTQTSEYPKLIAGNSNRIYGIVRQGNCPLDSEACKIDALHEPDEYDTTGSYTKCYTPNRKFDSFSFVPQAKRENKHFYFESEGNENGAEIQDPRLSKYGGSSCLIPSSSQLYFCQPYIYPKSSVFSDEVNNNTTKFSAVEKFNGDVDDVEVVNVVEVVEVADDDVADVEVSNVEVSNVEVANVDFKEYDDVKRSDSEDSAFSDQMECGALSSEDSDEYEPIPNQLHLIYDDSISDDDEASTYSCFAPSASKDVFKSSKSTRHCTCAFSGIYKADESEICSENQESLPDWSSMDELTTLESDCDSENAQVTGSEEKTDVVTVTEVTESRFISSEKNSGSEDSSLTSTQFFSRKRKASVLDDGNNDDVTLADTQPLKKIARLRVSRFALIAIKGFELCIVGFLALAAYGSYLENRFEYVTEIPPYGG